MKRWMELVGMSCILLSFRANAEMREFKLPDGRSLKAEVVGYNAKLDQVELQREDGKRVKVKPDTFVEDDQQYIKEWAMLDGFQNTSLLKVAFSKKITEKWKMEDAAFQTHFARNVYDVNFENRNEYPIENLKAEYRIFYEQGENDQSTKKVVVEKKVQSGMFDLDRLEPRGKRTLTTESVVLEEFEFNTTDYYVAGGDPESTTGKIKGIWLRLSITTSDGQTAMRNVFEPSSLEGKYSWPEHVQSEKPKKGKGKKKG